MGILLWPFVLLYCATNPTAILPVLGGAIVVHLFFKAVTR